MKGAIVILLALVVIGVVLYIVDIFFYRRKGEAACSDDKVDNNAFPDPEKMTGDERSDTSASDGEVCCGMHMVCEKTNLSPISGEVVYYDDEELDRFRGREADGYTPEEIEEFRDVLMTLLPQDVAGWSRSVQVRGISLPTEVRDELILIVSELRHT